MSAQPEALRLADLLDLYYENRGPADEKQAAAELRRLNELHELYQEKVQRLTAGNKDCLNHFDTLMDERNQLLDALETAIDVMLDKGIPVDPEHPHRLALNQAEAAVAKSTRWSV